MTTELKDYLDWRKEKDKNEIKFLVFLIVGLVLSIIIFSIIFFILAGNYNWLPPKTCIPNDILAKIVR